LKARRQTPRMLKLFDGVYPPGEDSYLLLDCISRRRSELGSTPADVGTGSGILALEMAQTAPVVLAADINPAAARCAQRNAEISKLGQKVDVICSDGLEPIRISKKFSAVVSNPPYLPEEASLQPRIEDRVWTGGKRGVETSLRFIRQAVQHLKPAGSLWIVLSSLSGMDEPLQEMRALGYTVELVDGINLFFERLAVVKAVKG